MTVSLTLHYYHPNCYSFCYTHHQDVCALFDVYCFPATVHMHELSRRLKQSNKVIKANEKRKAESALNRARHCVIEGLRQG